MKIGIIGNGNVARALGSLLQGASHEVVFSARAPKDAAREQSFAQAASFGEVVVIAIPYLACASSLPELREALKGKVVIDATNPLNGDWSPILLGEESSGGEEIARVLPQSNIVKAFNTIFADCMSPARINREGQKITAFLCGDQPEAVRLVAQLAEDAGFSPVDTGPLRVARYVEAMAHLNIQLAVAKNGGTNSAFLYHQSRA